MFCLDVPSVRLFRARVLLICTYLLPFIVLWTAKTTIAGVRRTETQRAILADWFHYSSCSMTAYMGAFDSFVMGGLYKRLGWCCCQRLRSHHVHNTQHNHGADRQIQDSRIRFGQSLLEGSPSGARRSLSTLATSGEKKESGDEDVVWTEVKPVSLKSTAGAGSVEQDKTPDVLTAMSTVL